MKLGTIDIEKIYVGSNDIEKGYVGSSEVYSSGPDYTEPFYIKNLTNSNNTLTFKTVVSSTTRTIYKSTDRVNWDLWGTTNTSGLTVVIPANSKVYLRCDCDSLYQQRISCSGNYEVGGNSMSMLYGTNFTGNETRFFTYQTYIFADLFYNSTTLKSAKNLLLPSTFLYGYCYSYMFSGCTSLTTAPELPATMLAKYCYSYMFSGCTSLTTAPELPATTLTESCYYGMFQRCTNLSTAPVLPATTLTESCYRIMFNGCTRVNSITCLATSISAIDCTYYWLSNVAATGTFTTPSSTKWGTGISGIPSGWTRVNV